MFSIFNRKAGVSEGEFSPANSSPSSAMSPSASPQSSSTIVTGPARPIRLVYCDEKGKFKMDPEAVAVLQLVKEPVGVVSVCGRARQGKSFILNQLLGRSSGFHVASTHRPCTKGLWLWSSPLKRTALDGTTYNLLLIDSEGIDAYDQTGTYSTQIFSLAVLLSSMFIYNQMGGIDEAALDRLSLVTQMTKHIRVKATGGRSSASELGQLSPIFVWLLRDFYLDLVEDNRRITPRDYLEIALRPVQGAAKDVSAKNEIRDSIRALFPDRECYTLVRPLNNENDLQRLDQIPLEKLRPEFRSGLDALTKFVFERSRPKQVFGTVMTGPILVGITESYLEALNNGAVPTISSSWQSVEESECRRAYEMATEAYMSSFDRSKPPDESFLREAHEEATQKALSAFNNGAVGVGATRKKFESLLQKFFKKAFEDYKKTAFAEADTQCANAIQNMERKLRTACHASDVRIDKVVSVLTTLVSEYEASSHGPNKWQKLSVFLQQSVEGPIRDVVKKVTDQIGMEKSSLALKLRSIEDKTILLNKQLEASEKNKAEFMKRYDEAINDKKKVTDDYLKRIADLQSSRSSLDERLSSLAKSLEASRNEAAEWKRKYDAIVSKMKSDEDHLSSEIGVFRSRCSAAEARLAAAQEQAKAAQEEAFEWKRKYDITVRETKTALEKAAVVQERSAKETQLREDSLRKKLGSQMAEIEEKLMEKTRKLEQAEQLLGPLRSELTASESKMKTYESEVGSLKEKLNLWISKFDSANMKLQSQEAKSKMVEQERNHLEVELQSQMKRSSEMEERCKSAEKEARRAAETAEKARNEAAAIEREKASAEKASMERLAKCERAQREIDGLEREKQDLVSNLKRAREAERVAVARVGLLEGRVEEREREIEKLLEKDNVERAETVKSLHDLLERERRAHQEANKRAEEYSVALEEARGKVDNLQRELTAVRLNETALDSKLRSSSQGKRGRGAEGEPGQRSKRARGEENQDEAVPSVDEDYTKFTVQRLKQELTSRDFGDELLKLRNPSKKDFLALYERCVLHKQHR